MSKTSRQPGCISRRDFMKTALLGSCALLTAGNPQLNPYPQRPHKPAVSIVKINRLGTGDVIAAAVTKALDLLGGIDTILSGKQRVMLKPNLVTNNPKCTTNPEVIGALAQLMQKHGKTVSIGEGSAVMAGYNLTTDGTPCIIYDTDQLDAMQQAVFDDLGYTQLAASLGVDLVNLHTGNMVTVEVPKFLSGALVYRELTLHKSLTEIDLLCSVPMMKTHNLAQVSLGMKNLLGLYPGSEYGTVRHNVHDDAALAGSPGVAYETIDMVRANKLGLVVIDASTAMEGDGPLNGDLVQMDLIIAGTNPLATDMVAAYVMGFQPYEVPTFVCANSVGMGPQCMWGIEVRGESLSDVQRNFARPPVAPWPIGLDWDCPP